MRQTPTCAPTTTPFRLLPPLPGEVGTEQFDAVDAVALGRNGDALAHTELRVVQLIAQLIRCRLIRQHHHTDRHPLTPES